MSKDYAKRSARHHEDGEERSAFAWWFLLGLVLLLVGAGLWYLHFQTGLSLRVVKQASPLEATTPVRTQADIPQVPKPTFEFYTVLPNGAHTQGESVAEHTPSPVSTMAETSGSSAQTALAAGPARREATPAEAQYVLQIAAFQSRTVAEALQAKLLLKGYSVKLDTTKQKGIVWYKVIVGPFSSKLMALQQKQKLSSEQDLDSIIFIS